MECKKCNARLKNNWKWCPWCALPTDIHPSPEWAIKMLVIDRTVQKVIGTKIEPEDDVKTIERKVIEEVESGLLDITFTGVKK